MPAKTWWGSNMAWWNYGGGFNPLNWPGDISSSFVHQVEGAIGYIISLVLNSFLTVINSIFSFGMTLFENGVSSLINLAISLGPFALPIFGTGITAFLGGLYLTFGMVKDMPVVGALA